MNSAPNRCTLTLVVVNAVSLSFQLTGVVVVLCEHRHGLGFGVGSVPGGALLSRQATSNRTTSDNGSVRLAMSDPRPVH